MERERGGGAKEKHTSYGMVSSVLGTDSAVAVAVETRHGLLGEEGEGLLED